jgi:hypothetical protein
VETLEKTVSANPRKIKRVLNLLRVTEAIIEGTPGLAGLQRGLVIRLVVLRVQSPELFADVVRTPDLLVALELAYRGKLSPNSPEFDARFKSLAERMRGLMRDHYGSHDFLAPLFADSAFEAATDDLRAYLTMIGG